MKMGLINIFFLATACLTIKARAQPKNEINRLKNRVSVLERKVSFDSLEFRQDIGYLMSVYNKTSTDNNVKNDLKETCTDPSKTLNSVKELAANGLESLESIKKGFNNEKKFLRDNLATVKESQINHAQTVEIRLNKFEEQFHEEIARQNDEIIKNTGEVKTLINNFELSFRENVGELSSSDREQTAQIYSLETRFSTSIRNIQGSLKSNNDRINNMERQMDNLRRLSCERLPSWVYNEGSCYYMGKTKLSWEDARKTCASMGAYLVEIESEVENDYLVKLWSSAGLIEGSSGPWIGASDQKLEGHFTWEHSGRSLVSGFQHWGVREPNGGTLENCLHKASWKDGWNDSVCSETTTFTCELHV